MKYAGMRAASNVLLRDVNVSLIIEEMYRGANVIYADFTDYDELAHHCGPERVESFEALDGVDARPRARSSKAAEDAPRPYKFVVLSDHGQSLGATFKQRYGKSLGDVVRDLMGGRATVIQTKTTAEGGAFVNSFLSEVTRSQGHRPGRRARGARRARRRTASSTSTRRTSRRPPTRRRSPSSARATSGLVWFTGNDHRLTARGARGAPSRTSSRRWPRIPGVAMLLVRSSDRGAVVFGHDGVRYLDEDQVEGEDPTTPFGPHTVMSLKREDEMEHAPDLLLISQYDPELGEVAAFEELIGSHGGLGGPQTRAVHPPPRPSGARRGGPARRAGDLPQPAALAGRDRDRAREAAGRGAGGSRGQPGGTRRAGSRSGLTSPTAQRSSVVPTPRLGGAQDEHRGGRILDRDAHGLVEGQLVRRRAAGRGPGDQLADLGAGMVRADDPPLHGAGELDGARGWRRERRRARLDDEHGVADRIPVHLALARPC